MRPMLAEGFAAVPHDSSLIIFCNGTGKSSVWRRRLQRRQLQLLGQRKPQQRQLLQARRKLRQTIAQRLMPRRAARRQGLNRTQCA